MKIFRSVLAAALAAMMIVSCGTSESEQNGETQADAATDTASGEVSSSNAAVIEANVGDVIERPEKMFSLDGVTDLTLKQQLKLEDGTMVDATNILRKVDDSYICVYGRIVNQLEESTIFGYSVWQGYDPEQDYYAFANLSYYGVDIDFLGIASDDPEWVPMSSYYKDGLTKLDDATVNGYDCYVYEYTYYDEYEQSDCTERLYVDKETGLVVINDFIYPEFSVQASLVSVEYNSDGLEDAVSKATQHYNPALHYITNPVSIEKTVLFDKDGVKITAEKMDWLYCNLYFTLENNTDKDIRIDGIGMYINGLPCYSGFVHEYVKPHSTVKAQKTLYSSSFEVCDFEYIKDIDMNFSIESGSYEAYYDDETDSTSYHFVGEGFITEDTGYINLKTDCPEDYSYEMIKDGTVLYDGEVKFVYNGFFENPDGGIVMRFYVKNNADERMMARAYLKAINGEDFDETARVYVDPGAETYLIFSVSEYYLKDFDRFDTISLGYRIAPVDRMSETVAQSGDSLITVSV